MEKEQSNVSKNQSEIKTLIHESGRESDVKIGNKDKIGNGHFGGIYRVDVSLADEEGKLRELREKFALKDFWPDKNESNSKPTERALLIHSELKKAGVKTWTTYRLIKDESAILMTDGERDKTMLISTSDASRSKNKLLNNPLNRIENYKSTLDSAIQDALNAGAAGMAIPPDAWFANFKALPERNKLFAKFRPKDNGAKLISLFVGDFDRVVLKDNLSPETLARREENIGVFYYERKKFRNLMCLKIFLDTLIDQTVQYPYRNTYQKIATNKLGEQAEIIAKKMDQKGAWKKFLSGRTHEKNREIDEDNYPHQVFKEESEKK